MIAIVGTGYREGMVEFFPTNGIECISFLRTIELNVEDVI